MVVLLRSKDIQSDSRASKYIDYFRRNGIEYRIVAWDRCGAYPPSDDTINYPRIARYGAGGFEAVNGRLGWMKFVYDTLRQIPGEYTIHACDLDCVYPAVVFRTLSRRKVRIVFDVFDWFTDTLYNQNRLILTAFKYMERFSTKHSDHIIICEPERIRQIPYDISDKYSVLPNIPAFDNNDFLVQDSRLHFDNDKVTLSYVGSLEENRCLDMLIDGAEQGMYNLLIAGYGQQRLEDRLRQIESDNVRYFGKVKYTDGLKLMFNSDLIYAMYSPVNPNHIYAAPNKYYEAMFLGKPIITTRGILMADKVLNNQVGYVIGETLQDLQLLIDNLDRDQMQAFATNSSALWTQYRDYFNNYMADTYSKYI